MNPSDESQAVLVVADQMLTRAGLSTLLEDNPRIEIVGAVAADEALLDSSDRLAPDVVVIDFGWSQTRDSTLLRDISSLGRPVVALVPNEDECAAILGALRTLGSYGLLLNDIEADALHMAIDSVLAGLLVIDPALAEVALSPSNIATRVDVEITPREDDVLQLLAHGLTNKAIARELAITDHTVKFHVNSIMTKLGAQSRTEAVVVATRAGLIIL